MPEIYDMLLSDDLNSQVRAYEEIYSLNKQWAEAVIIALKKSENASLLAERLPILGSACIPLLQSLLLEEELDKNIRILVGLALFNFGAPSAIPILLDEVRSAGPRAAISVKLLSFNPSSEVIKAILDCLEKVDYSQEPLIGACIMALKRLSAELPSDLKERYMREDTPWQIRAYFDSAAIPSSKTEDQI